MMVPSRHFYASHSRAGQPEMQHWKIQLLSRLWGMWHFRWWGMAAAWGVCLFGWFVVQALPNKYESAAKVYIDTDTLMRPLMAGMTVTRDVNQQVDVMMRTLITRPSIEQVVKLSDPKMASASSSALASEVNDVQKSITLKPLDTKNLFSIAYANSDPVFAQTVTQSLVTLLVNSNLGNQRRNVDGVETFLDRQIAKYEAQLRDMEKRRADFRTANMEFYSATNPSGDANDIIDKAHAETVDAQNQLGIETARRDSLATQLRGVAPTMRVDAAPPIVLNDHGSGNQTDLTQATLALTNLESRFTDSHPDVVAQKKLVERLKSQESGSTGGANPYRAHQGVPNPVYINLQSKLADSETNLALQRRRLEQATLNEQKARSEMAQAVTVSRQYADLDRDYEVIHKNYLDLVARREAARLSRAVGDQESDTVFRVIEPPQTPDVPVSPNRLMLNSIILVLGILVGMGVTFLFHVNRDAFSVSDQLSEAFDIPVLGSVSHVNALSQQIETRRAVTLVTSGLATMLFFYGVLAIASYTNLIARIRGLI
jgi:polysaccharide chain length determinant protein (PEP-CTERM system associated)